MWGLTIHLVKNTTMQTGWLACVFGGIGNSTQTDHANFSSAASALTQHMEASRAPSWLKSGRDSLQPMSIFVAIRVHRNCLP